MINALMYVEKLEETGFTSEQAKTSVGTWLELMNDNLATKNEMTEIQAATKFELLAVRSDFNKEFAAVRHEMKDLKIEISEMEKRINKTIFGSVGFFATILGILSILTR